MTESKSPIPDYMREAAVIFAAELETHLASMKKIVASVGSGGAAAAVLAEQAKSLSGKFHTIKGGAGFLQLERLKNIGADGEKLFKGAIDAANADAVQDQLKEFVSGLEAELITLKADLGL